MNTYFADEIQNLDSEDANKFKAFVDAKAYQPMSESLAKATIDQLGGLEEFIDYHSDIANNGACNGFGGFIYHTELEKFYSDNKKDILDFAHEHATQLGVADSAIENIAHFNSMTRNDISVDDIAEALHNEDSDNRSLVVDNVCWYVLESLSYAFTEFDHIED